MKDGQTISYKIADDAKSIRFECKSGLSRVFNLNAVHQKNLERACAVGFAQVRIVDAAAVGRADKEGNIIPEFERVQMKWDRMMRLIEHYESGTEEWNLKGTGRTARPKGPNFADIREALRRLGIVEEKISGLGEDKLKELAGSKRVAEKMLEIEKERLTDRADADGMLDELMEGEEEEDLNESELPQD